jgi:hypothetical protein
LLLPCNVIHVHLPSSSEPEARTLEQLSPTTASSVPPGFQELGALIEDVDVTTCTVPKCSVSICLQRSRKLFWVQSTLVSWSAMILMLYLCSSVHSSCSDAKSCAVLNVLTLLNQTRVLEVYSWRKGLP